MVRGVLIIEGHVQGLANARSAAELDLPVWIMHHGSCIASSSKSCQRYIPCNPYSSMEFIEDLVKIGIENNLKEWLIIPSNDYAVLNIAKNKSKLSPYYKTFSSETQILEKIINKSALLEVAMSFGVPVPETYPLKEQDDICKYEFNFPLLTRGIVGQDFYKKIGVKALESKNIDELELNLKKVSQHFDICETITQELIQPINGHKSITASTCCLCVNGTIFNLWSGEKLNEHPVLYGTATLARSTTINELHEPAKALVKALGYTGICEIEWLYNEKQKKYNLIELNPRTWLWVELAKASGIDFVKDMIRILNGEDIIKNRPYETNIYWYNPITYYPFKILSLIKNVPSFSPRGKVVNALFKKGDNKPGWTYLWTIFNILKRR